MGDRSHGGREVSPAESGTLAAEAVRRREFEAAQQREADERRAAQQREAAGRRTHERDAEIARQRSAQARTASGTFRPESSSPDKPESPPTPFFVGLANLMAFAIGVTVAVQTGRHADGPWYYALIAGAIAFGIAAGVLHAMLWVVKLLWYGAIAVLALLVVGFIINGKSDGDRPRDRSAPAAVSSSNLPEVGAKSAAATLSTAANREIAAATSSQGTSAQRSTIQPSAPKQPPMDPALKEARRKLYRGVHLVQRSNGDRAQSAADAVALLRESLELVHNDETDNAMAHFNLGFALLDQRAPTEKDYMDAAIALLIANVTYKDQYPDVYSGIGAAYARMTSGDRVKNSELAKKNSLKALESLKRENSPNPWVRAQHTLAMLHADDGAIPGPRQREFLTQAIIRAKGALLVYTPAVDTQKSAELVALLTAVRNQYRRCGFERDLPFDQIAAAK